MQDKEVGRREARASVWVAAAWLNVEAVMIEGGGLVCDMF